jgi:hypothetical protein
VISEAREIETLIAEASSLVARWPRMPSVEKRQRLQSLITRMLRLSFLAPDITRAIVHGRQPAELNVHKMMADTRAPIDWHEQRAGLGFV